MMNDSDDDSDSGGDDYSSDSSTRDELLFEVPNRKVAMYYTSLLGANDGRRKKIVDYEDANAYLQKKWFTIFEYITENKEVKREIYTDREWRQLLLIQDHHGRLLLHHALRQQCSIEIMKLLIGTNEKIDHITLSHRTKKGNLAIHQACRGETGVQIVSLVSKDSKGTNFINQPDGEGNFPLDLVGESAGGESLRNDYSKDNSVMHFLVKNTEAVYKFTEDMFLQLLQNEDDEQDTIFNAIDSICNNCSPEIFRKIVLKNLEYKNCLEWMTWAFIKPNIISQVMLDFYLSVTWIILFFYSSTQHMNDELQHRFLYVLHVISLMFLLGEFRLIRRYKRADVIQAYVFDPWNWLNMITVILVIISTVILQIDGSRRAINDYSVRILLNVTAAGQVVRFTSFLKTLFLPFATFVGGITRVLRTLVPFAVCTTLILITFAFMYRIQESDESSIEESSRFLVGGEPLQYDTFGHSLISVLNQFLVEPDKMTTALDILFGIISHLILLNVIIAIVSMSWDKTNEKEVAARHFWQYRLSYIQNMNLSRKVANRRTRLEHSLNRRFHSSRENQGKRVESAAILYLCYKLQYLVYFSLGLVSFGLLWPSSIKRDIFGINFDDRQTEEERNWQASTNAQNEIVRVVRVRLSQMEENNRSLVKENRKLHEKIDKLQSALDRFQSLESAIENIQSIVTKLAPQRSETGIVDTPDKPPLQQSEGLQQQQKKKKQAARLEEIDDKIIAKTGVRFQSEGIQQRSMSEESDESIIIPTRSSRRQSGGLKQPAKAKTFPGKIVKSTRLGHFQNVDLDLSSDEEAAC